MSTDITERMEAIEEFCRHVDGSLNDQNVYAGLRFPWPSEGRRKNAIQEQGITVSETAYDTYLSCPTKKSRYILVFSEGRIAILQEIKSETDESHNRRGYRCLNSMNPAYRFVSWLNPKIIAELGIENQLFNLAAIRQALTDALELRASIFDQQAHEIRQLKDSLPNVSKKPVNT